MAASNDQILLDQIRSGDDKAFELIVRQHLGWMNAAARRRLGGDAHRADDVVQAAFVVLLRNADRVKLPLGPWLFGIIQNLAANAQRDEFRRRAREQKAASMSPKSLPDEPASFEHLSDHLEQLVGRLRPRDREVIVLRFYQRLEIAQIAAELKISAEAARKRLERAVDKLRDAFARRKLSISALGLSTMLLTHAAPPADAEQIVRAIHAAHSASNLSPSISQLANSIKFARPIAWVSIASTVLGTAAVLAAIGWIITLIHAPVTNTDAAAPPPTPTTSVTTNLAVDPAPTTLPTAIKVGWLVSEYTADGPNPWDNRAINNYSHVTAIRPRFLDPEIDLYPIIEPGTANTGMMPQVLHKCFPNHEPLEASNPDELATLDVIVVSRCWNLKPEVILGITQAVSEGRGLLLHSFNGEQDPGLQTPALQTLLCVPNAQRFHARDSFPITIVQDHPLLSGLKPGTTFPLKDLNGVMGIDQGQALIAAPGAVADNGTNSADLPSGAAANKPSPDVFYPLYITHLGEGKVIACQWDSLPKPLVDASKGRFYIHCCQWLADRKIK